MSWIFAILNKPKPSWLIQSEWDFLGMLVFWIATPIWLPYYLFLVARDLLWGILAMLISILLFICRVIARIDRWSRE